MLKSIFHRFLTWFLSCLCDVRILAFDDHQIKQGRPDVSRHFHIAIFVGGLWPLTRLLLFLGRQRRASYIYLQKHKKLIDAFATTSAVSFVLSLMLLLKGFTAIEYHHPLLVLFGVAAVIIASLLNLERLFDPHVQRLYENHPLLGAIRQLCDQFNPAEGRRYKRHPWLVATAFCSGVAAAILVFAFHTAIVHLMTTCVTRPSEAILFEHGRQIKPFLPLLSLALVLFGIGVWLMSKPLLLIRVDLLRIGDRLPCPKEITTSHHRLLRRRSKEEQKVNIAIRVDNDETFNRMDLLLTKLMHVGNEWIPDLRLPQDQSEKNAGTRRPRSSLFPNVRIISGVFQYRFKRSCLFPIWKAVCRDARQIYLNVKGYLRHLVQRSNTKSTLYPPTPELTTLKLEIQAISRFSLQQYLVPRNSNQKTPIPYGRNYGAYMDESTNIPEENDWERTATAMFVSLRLHSFQLFWYFSLLTLAVVLVAFEFKFQQIHTEPIEQLVHLGPFFGSCFFLLWAVFSLILRSQQVDSLKRWAERHKGQRFGASPMFYYRADRPGDEAWEELVTEDFDMEIKNFGLDHMHAVEFTHAALLIIAFYILEKLL